MKIVYEVTCVVEPSLAERFERYMTEQHIPEVVAAGNFVSARLERDGTRYRSVYTAPSRDALERYLADESPRLREDFAEHFPSGIEATRAEWQIVTEVLGRNSEQ